MKNHNDMSNIFAPNPCVMKAKKPIRATFLYKGYMSVVDLLKDEPDWITEDELVMLIWSGETTRKLSIRYMLKCMFMSQTVDSNTQGVCMKNENGVRHYKYM